METEFSDLNGNVDQDIPAQMNELGSGVEDEDFEVVISDDDEQHEDEGSTQHADEPAGDNNAEESQAGEANDDDDTKSYSAKVRKRIERERKIAREARERAAQLEAELAAERSRRSEAESHLVTTAEANIEAQITAKKEEKRTARENGDTDTELRVDDELAQLREDMRAVQSAKAAQPEKTEQPAPKKAPVLNSHTKAWLDRNPWMNEPQYAMQNGVTRAIDAQMAREGFDPNTPEYFDELDKRIDAVVKVPRQPKKPTQETRPRQNTAPRSVGMGDSGESAPRSGGKIVLTKTDLANMRTFGLDPNNKVHLREYAKNKGARA